MKVLSVAHLKEIYHFVVWDERHIICFDTLFERFKWNFNWSFYVLCNAVSNVVCVLPCVSDSERSVVLYFSYLVYCFINCGIIRFLVHANDFSENNMVSILEGVLCLIDKCDKTVFFTRNTVNHYFYRVLTVFIQNFEFISKVIKNIRPDSLDISRYEENLIFSAELIIN